MSEEMLPNLDAIGQPISDKERAQQAVEKIEAQEKDDLIGDLAAEHPHGEDVGDHSAKFKQLMMQIDDAETDQERITHYKDALEIVTTNWLGEQGLKVGEVALMLGGMMVGLGALATKAIKSIFVIGLVMHLDHQLPPAYRMGRWDKAKIGGISAVSTAVVGWLPQVAAEGLEDGIKRIFSPLEGLMDGIEYGIEGAANWIPGVNTDIDLSSGVMGPIHSFIESVTGVLGFASVGVTEWFFNSTHAVLTIFYNHLEKEYTAMTEHLQDLQQQASSENQEEITELKQDIVTLQHAMTGVLDEHDKK